MKTWIKRIGTIGIGLVMLEVVAWVGLSLFGAEGIGEIKEAIRGPSATARVEHQTPLGVEKCAAFGGEMFCIKEASKAEGSGEPSTAERCSIYEGEMYCLKEDV